MQRKWLWMVYVSGWNWLKTTANQTGNDYQYSLLFTFTDERGYFRIGPYNFFSPGDNRLVQLKVTAVNHDVFKYGNGGEDQLPSDVGIIRINSLFNSK